MRIFTEIELRDLYMSKPFDSYRLVYPDKLTPAARQFLNDRRIKIIEEMPFGMKGPAEKVYRPSCSPNISLNSPQNGFLLLDTGKTVQEKPEEYTHIKGRMLVLKNHSRIKFRGKIDSLEASLINIIVELKSVGNAELTGDLTIIFEYLKKILRAEVLEEPLEFIEFKGWSEKEIREYSHHPEKYFGVKHFVPDPGQGKVMALLNIFRTQVRELEIAAVDAFYNSRTGEIERKDIILSLNRLSSLAYIIMCRYMGGMYKI